MKFGPYNFGYPGIDEHAKSAGLKSGENCWELIHDFTENESGEKNFSFTDPKDWKVEMQKVEGNDKEPIIGFPYPVRYGGTTPDDAYFGHDDDGGITFNIKNTS